MERTFKTLALAGLLAGPGLETHGAEAAPPPAPSWNPFQETGDEGDHLTGDWGGWRTYLTDRGVHIQAGYIGEVFGNVMGGVERGTVYEGLAEVALELDLAKVIRWPGGTVRVSGLSTHGDSPSELAGDALTASNIDAYDSFRLYEWWLQQSLFADTLSVRLGALLADEEFTGTTGGGRLINSAFGWPAFISGNVVNTGPAFNVPALGLRLHWTPAPGWHLQGGLFDGDSFDSPAGDPAAHPHGTHFQLNADQGMLALAEAGYAWNQSATNGALSGQLKVGAWFHTADFPDHSDPTRFHDHNFGAYIAIEQQLWREAEDAGSQGLEFFFRVGGSPEDRSTFAFTLDTGLSYTGLIPGRDKDKTTIGFVHAEISDQPGEFNAFSHYEQVLEVSYEFVLRPWWSVQPDLQWIHHPTGGQDVDDALLLGLRTAISF